MRHEATDGLSPRRYLMLNYRVSIGEAVPDRTSFPDEPAAYIYRESWDIQVRGSLPAAG
jgi:hypothetical protein